MISLNLLPDIKKEYLKTQRLKRLFIVGSLIVGASFVALVVLLGIFVFGVQRLQLSNAQSEIDSALAQVQSVEDLDKIVTIQKQLEALPGLHDNKPAADRLFDYLSTLVPEDVSLSQADFNFESDSLNGELRGIATSTRAVNVFVDTIKNAEFTYEGAEESLQPFESVVLDSTTVDDGEISYQINVRFNPLLFDGTISGAKLSVPNITTTNSVSDRPVLFDGEDGDSDED